jgi:subtilase family serine protease
MRHPSRVGIVAVAVGTIAGALTPAVAHAASSRAAVAGSVPPWATSSAFKGDAAGSDRVGFRLYLSWRNPAAAESTARAVSTPGNAKYRHFLTPAQFRQQFAPTQSDVTAVQQWLRSSGFTIDYTPANNHYVAAEGTVAQANAAFATRLGLYSYAGLTLRAPENQLSVPASLPHVDGVIGLDDSASLVHYNHIGPDATPSPVFRNATPLSDYWAEKNTATTDVTTSDGPFVKALDTTTTDDKTDTVDVPTPLQLPDYAGSPRPFATRGYTPDQLRSAYGLTTSNTGANQTVAVIDAYASPTIVQDVNTYYDAQHQGASGLYPSLNATNFQQVVAPGTFHHPERGIAQDPQGWYGEETLDIEVVHAMAPQAKIVYVGAPNNYRDLDAALNHVVDRHLANIVTNSYGFSGEALPFGYIKSVYDTMVQAVATGMGLYFSSGDDGDETGGDSSVPAQADWPASSPWVTAVGGTSLGVGQSGNRVLEKGWETQRAKLQTDGTTLSWADKTFLYGSGGGTSRLFVQPSYQSGTVPDSMSKINDSNGPAMRVVPDVSAVGDPNTGFRVGQTQTDLDGTTSYDEFRLGGTSLSSPLMAGLMADVQQVRGAVIGFANPLFYAQAGVSTTYNDITAATDLAVARVDYVNSADATDGLTASIRTIGDDAALTIHAGNGYDDVTGLGSPGGSFIADLASATPLSP